MKTLRLSCIALVIVTLRLVAGDTNLVQSQPDWELVRSVSNLFGGTIDFVLIPESKVRDVENYRAAANAIAGTRDRSMINFWTNRSQIPKSASMPVTNLQMMTASYERSPKYEAPYLRLACWLYPTLEEAQSANAIFFMPGARMPKSVRAANTNSIVGTWRWVRVDQQPVTNPFYMRFYPDNTSATWPAPKGFSTTKGVSRGGYHFDGTLLVLETGAGRNNPKAKVEIKGDELVMVGDETNRLIYQRVVPDLKPGKLQPGQVSHGPPEF